MDEMDEMDEMDRWMDEGGEREWRGSGEGARGEGQVDQKRVTGDTGYWFPPHPGNKSDCTLPHPHPHGCDTLCCDHPTRGGVAVSRRIYLQ